MTTATATAIASFPRRIEAIDAIFAFTAEVFAREGIEPAVLRTVDFVLEELFTNVVKYGRPSAAEVQVRLTKVPGGVEVLIADDDAERFDPSLAPEVDINAPIEEREPGGLGLHLIRKMVDSLEYRYDEERRASRTTFRKTLAAETQGRG